VSDLDERLREAGVDAVVLFGVATNLSVESTGRSAGDLGYRVVLAQLA
jgi:biuret amidohydrolase